MSVIVRLQNLPWAANAVDIRQYFHGLAIPEGGVHIVGGELGDAFIAFSTDEDARQAMLRDGGKIKEIKIRLFLSSRAEMQKIIDQARQQSLGMQQFMAMPAMSQMPVPVTNMAVPNLPVPNVAMANVQNVPSMQVPLQNVQNVAAMVSHMVPKQDDNAVAAPPAPPVGMLPMQPEHPAATPPTAGSMTTASSAKVDSEKDKKDKRRRRTRSHSRDQSDSRSRSRSASRSRSRSKDRKGRDRDRYYDRDRRRRRSRSRERRRRRDRSRSRERSSRDKRRDYRHESREDVDETSQQSSSSRWSARAQRNQPAKPRSEFFNRQQQNQDVSFGPRGETNTNNVRPPFPPAVNNQGRLAAPVEDVKNQEHQIVPPEKVMDRTSELLIPTSNSALLPPSSTSTSTHSGNINAMSPSNIFSGFQQNPPEFNPQLMVSYPTFSPSGMGSFNNSGFGISGSQQQKGTGGLHQLNSNKPESNDNFKKNVIDTKNTKPNLSPSVVQQTNGNQINVNKPEHVKSDLPSEAASNDIPLPDNSSMQHNNSTFGWGYGGANYGYGNMNPYSNFSKEQENTSSVYREQFQPPEWQESQEKNAIPNKIPNTCVQIKNVTSRTTAEDIRAFFRNSYIPSGWLKILGCDTGETDGIVYVRFTSLKDKKQAILRSGCLLSNAIVTVLHVDDSVFESAVDNKTEFNASPSGFWNTSREPSQTQESVNKPHEKKQLNVGNTKEANKDYNCIKIEGTLRNHPFFTHHHKVYPHIRSVCDRYKPVDVCVTKAGGQNLISYIKFNNSDVIESVMRSLNNVKVEGRTVPISVCSEEEFHKGKSNCMPLDAQKFLKMSRPPGKKNNFDFKEEVKSKSKGSSGFSDPRIRTDEPVDKEHYSGDIEMNDKDEPLPDPPRNKVLLPTPPLMHPPYDPNQMLSTNCIMIHNLPYQANENDILDFFSDIGVIPTQIHIMLDMNGKPSGDAFCEFEKSEEASSAAGKNNCLMGRNTVFVRLVSRQEMESALGLSVKAPGPGMPPQQGPHFNGPPGPGPAPMYGNMRMDQPPRGDWGPPYPPGPGGPDGPQGPESPYEYDFDYDYDDEFPYNTNVPSGRGSGRGSRGFRGGRGRERGRGGDRGRGGERGRGSSRGAGSFRGGGGNMRGGPNSMRGSFRGSGERGSRGRGRGGNRDMSESSRNHPLPLMSIPSGHPTKNTAQIHLEENTVREFGKSGCVVSVENVPFRADVNDILDFFGDFRLTPECVIRRYNDEGKITGDARVAFESPSEARRAIKFLNHKMLGNRSVTLSLFK